jgi:hypothetical protein
MYGVLRLGLISHTVISFHGFTMNETEKKRVPNKSTVVALGIICIILAAILGVAVTAFTLAINDKNEEISQLNSSYNSSFELLFSYFSNLQNQSTPALNVTGATFVSISQINLDPTKWENKAVVVVGRLTGPWAYPEAISYYYVLSLNETVTSSTGLDVNSIGVDFGNRGAVYNGSTALVVGVVEKGTIGTNEPKTVYCIEEQAVLTS